MHDPVDLVGGGIDFAIRAGQIRDDNLIARRLLTSRLVVVASPACIKAHGRPEHPEALGGYPCLASRSHEGRAVWCLARTARGAGPGAVGAGAAAVRVAVKARLTVNGMGALIASAEAGLGAALVPEQMVRSGLAAGRLVRLLTGYCQDGGGVFAVYARGQQTSAALRAFVEFLVAAAAAAAR